ncbi:disintegrin and metalloproteinase domain-containing protein 10 [Eurytemora carolleeae]|uniref:disintegrin and metalloproteinase domain-containing protein 10 n=1 Tax=Eurytemora carolleeae TaxID=1294199 RepID=UPI000C787ACA|nr:disintegrin and metalloproteinase domain-containing protein 10 [Eurytemora carolleeae]|eukprot:XP_023343181.1 disintegrin and metalloproteinase domain-containing protein 10-like [Eurytemora affinis]
MNKDDIFNPKPVLQALPENDSVENGSVKVEITYCKNNDECVDTNINTKYLKRRFKRNLDPGLCEMEIFLNVFEANMTLCLHSRKFKTADIVKDKYNGINVTVFQEENASVEIPLSTLELEYIVGYVREEPYSSIDGYLIEHHFYGVIYVQDHVHYLESSLKKSIDLHVYLEGLKSFIPAGLINQTKNSSCQPKVCELTLVADHFFYDEVGKSSLHNTVMLMLWHAKEANRFFTMADFDSDGYSDCFGITVGELTVFTTKNSTANLLNENYSQPEDFLKRFSRYNFDGYCLGALFTSRSFVDLVLGLAWRGTLVPDGVGGACQSRVRITSDVNPYSFNALFVSLKSKQDQRIPIRMGVLNFVHEILHSLGAKHDPEPAEREDCTPLDKHFNGRFLMSKFSNDGHKLNHAIMSPCTKESVNAVLKNSTKLTCLQFPMVENVCGNGFLEKGEECDCGTVFMCTATKSCCSGPEGYGSTPPCAKRNFLKECAS